jgi:putative flippase GtrA
VARELPLFIVLSAVGLGIAEFCLVFSHYVLGYHSVLSDNLSANGIGLVLGMLWRFWSFKRWVFLPDDPERDEEAAEATIRTTV